jgi:hypothetical protein
MSSHPLSPVNSQPTVQNTASSSPIVKAWAAIELQPNFFGCPSCSWWHSPSKVMVGWNYVGMVMKMEPAYQ